MGVAGYDTGEINSTPEDNVSDPVKIRPLLDDL